MRRRAPVSRVNPQALIVRVLMFDHAAACRRSADCVSAGSGCGGGGSVTAAVGGACAGGMEMQSFCRFTCVRVRAFCGTARHSQCINCSF
jgi:hypothetical protein